MIGLVGMSKDLKMYLKRSSIKCPTLRTSVVDLLLRRTVFLYSCTVVATNLLWQASYLLTLATSGLLSLSAAATFLGLFLVWITEEWQAMAYLWRIQ